MLFAVSYFALGALLLGESLVLAHVLRGTARAASSYETHRLALVDLRSKIRDAPASESRDGATSL